MTEHDHHNCTAAAKAADQALWLLEKYLRFGGANPAHVHRARSLLREVWVVLGGGNKRTIVLPRSCSGASRDPLGMACRPERAEDCPRCGERSCVRHSHHEGACPGGGE